LGGVVQLVDDTEKGQLRSRLTSAQRRLLLDIARRSIETHLEKGDEEEHLVEDPGLTELGAAFVTLTHKDRLRGCIGYSEPLYPLYETVARCAVAAATNDYRFAPVTLEELPDVNISISTLTPLEKLENLEELEPGRHGLMITGQGRRGLLLPQVAEERGWDRETFFSETCRKAGLPSDAWKGKDVEIFVFEAVVFSEDTI
jgi:AmmeMemoRadiSam system protein A